MLQVFFPINIKLSNFKFKLNIKQPSNTNNNIENFEFQYAKCFYCLHFNAKMCSTLWVFHSLHQHMTMAFYG
jgi:hypothetical protein